MLQVWSWYEEEKENQVRSQKRSADLGQFLSQVCKLIQPRDLSNHPTSGFADMALVRIKMEVPIIPGICF